MLRYPDLSIFKLMDEYKNQSLPDELAFAVYRVLLDKGYEGDKLLRFLDTLSIADKEDLCNAGIQRLLDKKVIVLK